MTVAERRAALLEWFYADEERNGWGTVKIARWSIKITFTVSTGFLYPRPIGRSRHRAYRDLCALARDGQITRGQHGGKATWWYA